MFKLFLAKHGGILQVLKAQFDNGKSVVPISHLYRSCKTLVPNSKLGFIVDEVEDFQSSRLREQRLERAVKDVEATNWGDLKESMTVHISHPWPEWVELMEQLLQNGYFEGVGNPFRNGEMDSKDSNQIRTACLNFARDKYDLMRYLSRKDIKVVAGSGCPSIDRKVVNSGKRLREHTGIDEGNVCSSCILRGNCERAYVKAREDEGGRTVDVMRLLLTYGLDPVIGSVENKPCLTKRVKESVRRLLKEMVEFSTNKPESDHQKVTHSRWNLSVQVNSNPQGQHKISVAMKQGDWICPRCNFLNFARNSRCLCCNGPFQEKLRRLGEDQDHLPLKKGDWICDKCNFLNFAKNTRCLQCKEKPPKRQLNPGEWECESCNYINFRRNMVCLKCDHRRPKASNAVDSSAMPHYHNGSYHLAEPSARQERQSQSRRADMWRFVENGIEGQDGSNSWNEVPEFIDFPIAGGMSELSRNVQTQERWKVDMRGTSREAARARENANKFKSTICQNSELAESSDDEIAEWFGHRKNVKTDSLASIPQEIHD